jgi:recombination protein RecA
MAAARLLESPPFRAGESSRSVSGKGSMDKQARLKAVEKLGEQLDKQFETKGSFQRQGNRVRKPVPHIPTNLASVDNEVLGCGGWPKGRIIEIFGPEASGKTAIMLHTIGEVQKAGGVAAFIDAEHGLSPTFADNLGVDMTELVISQPDCGEDALETVEALVEAQLVDLVVIDSVTALVPRAELAGEMGDSHMGLQARLLSQACRKLVGLASKKEVTLAFINQIREKVGVVFGNPEVTTGGRALKFYSSVRVEVRRVAASKNGTLKDGEKIIGHRVHLKNVKNKVAFPYRECDVDLLYETGFDKTEDLINYALKIGVLTGSAWFVIPGYNKDEKFRRENIPLDILRKKVDDYHSALQAKSEAEYEKSREEAKADAES